MKNLSKAGIAKPNLQVFFADQPAKKTAFSCAKFVGPGYFQERLKALDNMRSLVAFIVSGMCPLENSLLVYQNLS